MKVDIEAGTLAVTGDLDEGAREEFTRACQDLLAHEPKEMFLDLSDVKYLSTACLGALFLVEEDASRLGTKLRVRVTAKMAGICKMSGLDKIVSLEVDE